MAKWKWVEDTTLFTKLVPVYNQEGKLLRKKRVTEQRTYRHKVRCDEPTTIAVNSAMVEQVKAEMNASDLSWAERMEADAKAFMEKKSTERKEQLSVAKQEQQNLIDSVFSNFKAKEGVVDDRWERLFLPGGGLDTELLKEALAEEQARQRALGIHI